MSSNYSMTSFNSTELSSLKSRRRFRYLQADELSNTSRKNEYRKFLAIASAEYASNNGNIKTAEVRKKFKTGEIFIPNFDIWLNTGLFIKWDEEEKKLALSSDRNVLVRVTFEKNADYKKNKNENHKNLVEFVENSKRLLEIRENEAALMTDNTETEVSNHQKDIESTDNGIQKKSVVSKTSNKQTINQNQLNKKKKKTVPTRAKQQAKKNSSLRNICTETSDLSDSNDDGKQDSNDKSETPVKISANEKKVLNKKLDDLAVSFFEKTNTVVEDASYEVVDVVDAKIENEDLFFKIKWKNDTKRGVKYSQSWEKGSTVSFSDSFVQEFKNRLGKKINFEINLPEKRKYIVKKVEVSNLPASTRAIADKFFEIDSFLSKNC
ncbi:unnamed protein product [Brachionus calyciflorus]|uniref:Chromo domain-containing protein n=1 Tax=Brachionus calyciflorus TaxID=104777 RepID=A0A814D650_9BILA|nr:unnamed protein product [Brachionus calyciflorus]